MKSNSIAISSEKISIIEQLLQEKLSNFSIRLSLDYIPMQYYVDDVYEIKFIYLILNITSLFKDCAPWLKVKEKVNGLKILSYSVKLDINNCNTEEEINQNNLLLNQKCDDFCRIIKDCFLYRALLAHNCDDEKTKKELDKELIPLDFYDKRDSRYEKKYKDYIHKLDEFLDELILRLKTIESITSFDFKNWKKNIFETLVNDDKPTFFAHSLINSLLPLYKQRNHTYIDKKQVEKHYVEALKFVMENNSSELDPTMLTNLIFSYLDE